MPLLLAGGRKAGLQLLEEFSGRIQYYEDRRDYPSRKGPSYLSVHLRFGTVSIRECMAFAHALAQDPQHLGAKRWRSELIWREFYHQILSNFPYVVEQAFKPAYHAIDFDDIEQDPQAQGRWLAWALGNTGYPLVDAAQRQLLQSGYMHNRLRMVSASFLIKHLGIHWRHGEAFFAQHLLDFDLAANNGGWQWAASSGCDAQPYFRIFNPMTQSEKFDADAAFIKRYVPELKALEPQFIHAPWQAPPAALARADITLGKTYPHPIVDHTQARTKTLLRYNVVKS